MANSKENSSNSSRRGIKSSKQFEEYMISSWDNTKEFKIDVDFNVKELQKITKKRRELLFKDVSSKFGIDTIVKIDSGELKVRNNDCNYYFRPDSSFIYLTGLIEDFEPNSTLVIDKSGSKLYIPSPLNSSSPEFYSNATYGEYWIGKRPSLSEFEKFTGIKTSDISNLKKITIPKRIERYCLEKISSMRLIKDDFEILELQKAIDSTKIGFENTIKAFNDSCKIDNGERLLESRFFETARIKGNDLGYSSIVASNNNATTLHWTRNNSKITDNSFILMDMGIEAKTLYTADITRCFPINGRFSDTQKLVYNAVLDAADTVAREVKIGDPFKKLNEVAFEVLVKYLKDFGIKQVQCLKDIEALRRYMPHGTSHHLGLDVHDCARISTKDYINAKLENGMVFSIEPGLYFKENDSLVPPEFRGIGVRIEDDVLMTENGIQNLSKDIPRSVEDVENWMKKVIQED